MSYPNGQLPASALAPVPGGRLEKDAAAAFNAMNAESEHRFGVTLRAEGPLGTYRTAQEQEALWKEYLAGGNVAARPGTSNHGLGLAIDLATEQMRHIVDQIGSDFGWAKAWSDAPTEWWHLDYRAGVWRGLTSPMPSADVAVVQQLLRRCGHTSVAVTGLVDQATLVELDHLALRGPVDAATISALRRQPAGHAAPSPGPNTIAPAKPSSDGTSGPADAGAPHAPHELSVDSSGAEVERWQLQMRRRGFITLHADGIFGPASERAAEWLQQYLGQAETGRVGQDLWDLTWTSP